MAMDNTNYTRVALGVYVSANSLEGALVGMPEDGPARVLHRIVRQRTRKGDIANSGDLGSVVPGLKSSEDTDFTIEIGGAGSSTSTPDPSVGGATNTGSSSSTGNGSSGGQSDRLPFDRQLKEILDECARMGYADPEIAFCATPPEISFTELVVTTEAKKKSGGGRFSRSGEGKPASKKLLLELLEEEEGAVFDRKRVDFYPMTPKNGQERYLAVIPDVQDNVTVSLQNLRNRDQYGVINSRLMETEITLYADLVRQQAPTETSNSAVVRVGADDTLILFFEGGELRHYERLRSLTSYDVPETICSRVMLQQDEKKVGDLDAIYLLSSREERLIDAFRKQYPDTAIFPLQEILPADQWDSSELSELKSTNTFPAIASALRLFFSNSEGENINLIGAPPKRRRASLAFAWHTYVALLLLIASTAFFGWTYVENEADIAEQKEWMEENPVEMPEVSPEEVRQNINAIQQEYAEYNRALEVLDSLLVGSDKWSRMLEKTSELTGSIPQIWFNRWSPQGNEISIDGFALTRGNVARLGRALDATIEQLEYNEINNRRIYSFVMSAPVAEEVPEIAEYLEEVAEGALPEPVSDDAGHLLESTHQDDD